MRYHYASLQRWHEIDAAQELNASAELTDDPAAPLSEATRVRIAVRLRRDARTPRPLPSARWANVTDRTDTAAQLWTPLPPAPCSVPRSAVLRARS